MGAGRGFAVAVLPLPGAAAPAGNGDLFGERNIAMFSCDLDSFDFKASKAQQVIDVTMKKLDKLARASS